MKKKKILMIIIMAVIGCFIFIAFDIKNNKMKTFEQIRGQLENKDDMLIYITSNNQKCYLCNNTKYILKYYQDIYHLDIIEVNKNSMHTKEYESIIQYIDNREDYIKEPALILIKDGHEVAVANEISMEYDIQNLLSKYEFIPIESEEGVQIDSDQFDKLYQSEELSLILFNSYTEEGLEYRENLFKLSKKYNFNYYIMIYGMASTSSSYRNIIEKYKKNFSPPFLVIIGNNQIIDVLESTDEEKLLEFLKKNTIV